MLPNYKHILYATDLTENSEHAFKHAMLLARKSSAKVHILHAIPEVDASFRSYVELMMGKGQLKEFEADHEKQARDTLSEKLEEFAREELRDFPEEIVAVYRAYVLEGQ